MTPAEGQLGAWAVGPAKWFAAGALSATSVLLLVWVVFFRTPTPPPAPVHHSGIVTPFAAVPDPGTLGGEPASSAELTHTAEGTASPGTQQPESDPAVTPALAQRIPVPRVHEPAPLVDDRPGRGPGTGADDGGPGDDPGAAPTPRPEPSEPPSAAIKINVNTASAAELELLPNIGPTLAARIVEDRTKNGPFRSLTDLQRVRGIGAKTAQGLADRVVFD